MLMTAAVMGTAKRQRALRVQHVRCSAADTELHSPNTQVPNQILLFEIQQAIDYFASKLSFIMSSEPVHLGLELLFPPRGVTRARTRNKSVFKFDLSLIKWVDPERSCRHLIT